MDTVSLECFKYNYKNEKEETQVFTYTLKPCTKENLCLDEGGWLVYEKVIPLNLIYGILRFYYPSPYQIFHIHFVAYLVPLLFGLFQKLVPYCG